MNTKQKAIIFITTAVFFSTVLGCSTRGPLGNIDPASVTQVYISHQNGGVGITDQSVIAALISAMQNAKLDPTAHLTTNAIVIGFQQGEKSCQRISANGPRFDVGTRVYFSKEFETAIEALLTRKK